MGRRIVSTPGVEHEMMGPPVLVAEAWDGLLSYHAHSFEYSVDVRVSVNTDGFRAADLFSFHLPIGIQNGSAGYGFGTR